LGVSKQSTKITVGSGLGRFPLYIDMFSHMFMYWYRLENSPSSLLKCAFNDCRKINSTSINNWYSTILFVSKELGINLSLCKSISKFKLKKLRKIRIQENVIKLWNKIKESYTQDSGKLNTYFKFKSQFQREKYLSMTNQDKRTQLTKFRISNHNLSIETDRHEHKVNSHGKPVILPRCERLCQNCITNSVEDEIHFMLECARYQQQRETFLEKLYSKFPNLLSLNYLNLFIWLMTNHELEFLLSLYEYLNHIFSLREKSN
jgi:hypothetical protein